MNPSHKALIAFAEPFQSGKTRKYSAEPIIGHWIRVASAAAKSIPEKENGAFEIGLFHDLIEDTNCSFDQIQKFLEENNYPQKEIEIILNGVEWLTEKYTHQAYKNLNRKERNILEAFRLGEAPAHVQTIKYCDIADNLPSIVADDPGFARKWIPEKILAVEQMKKGDSSLRKDLLHELVSSNDSIS